MSSSKFVALACLCSFIALAAAVVGAADEDCSSAKMALFPCLDAVKGANPPAPSKLCCDGMKGVTKDQMCNCLLKSASTVQGINMEAAKAIPVKCGIPLDAKTCGTTSH